MHVGIFFCPGIYIWACFRNKLINKRFSIFGNSTLKQGNNEIMYGSFVNIQVIQLKIQERGRVPANFWI